MTRSSQLDLIPGRVMLRLAPKRLGSLQTRPDLSAGKRAVVPGLCRAGFVSLTPKIARNRQRINPMPLPPLPLIASGMILIVMDGAERDRKFVTDLESQASGLRKPNMMRM